MQINKKYATGVRETRSSLKNHREEFKAPDLKKDKSGPRPLQFNYLLMISVVKIAESLEEQNKNIISCKKLTIKILDLVSV